MNICQQFFKFTQNLWVMKISSKTLVFTAFAITALLLAHCSNPPKNNIQSAQPNKNMIQINKSVFGTIDGKEVYLFQLEDPGKMIVRLTNYGGIVTSVIVPDRNGKMEDVVLGFDSLQDYLQGHPYFGCITGRYANRIAGGKFSIDGKEFSISRNTGENTLHGGFAGFDKKLWDAREYRNGDEAGIELTYQSPDGEEGFPGNLAVRVIYSLLPDQGLKIDYFATTDIPTPINLTHHGYFNLKGEGNGDIMDLVMMIDADKYTVVDESLMPTGELRNVTGTPFDFRKAKPIGQDFALVDGGYDHNFVLNNRGQLIRVARVTDPGSGRFMDVLTTEPGMQFYAGNFLDGTLTGKSDKPYQQHYAFCLETQHFPDSPNIAAFPNTILRPGETYRHTTIYRFGAE
jgi:aldose 1-epimerase